ncbi:MAG: MtrB/PioB family decaheme-associated outer membrane protein [Rubrivivax sp.]|nr:MtrB/PioB family decaheme-associated outer membrane protein [Rubrivivax sp.]
MKGMTMAITFRHSSRCRIARSAVGAAAAALLGGGVFLLPGAAAAAPSVDTSQWKCELCPFEKAGTSGTVEGGGGVVSRSAAKFGDHTGLDDKGPQLLLEGDLRLRDDDGTHGRVRFADLGLDSRAVALEAGREGAFDLRIGLSGVPRRFGEGARTPFVGAGTGLQTLPAGYPAGTTAAMPLASTLAPVALGYDRERAELVLGWQVAPRWTTQLSMRNDWRSGTQRQAGSFFANSSQLVVPLEQRTDRFEASAAYEAGPWQASVTVHASAFNERVRAVQWSNPFTPVIAGADSGQLAMAPTNRFQQVLAAAGWDVTPRIRVSGEAAFGRMTQDEPYLAATLNPNLAVGALPAASFDGVVDTFDAGARASLLLDGGARVQGSYARNVHDNRSASRAYPAVSTDMFVGAAARVNQPFSFTRDRFKLTGDLPTAFARLSAGAELDFRSRTLQEVASTEEATVWARAALRPIAGISMSMKLAHAQRDGDDYGVATWITPPENPLLRKFNLADRRRDGGDFRADMAVTDAISVGVNAGFARDRYTRSSIGLTDGRMSTGGVEVAAAITDDTQAHAFGQVERVRSRQAGSQAFAAADWTGEHRDRVDLLGAGVRHRMFGGALDIGADVVFSRASSRVRVDAGVAGGDIPQAETDLDSLRVRVGWQLSEQVALTGTYGYERMRSADWRLDGVAPDSVPNLLALGELAPAYRVHVLRLGLRYRF